MKKNKSSLKKDTSDENIIPPNQFPQQIKQQKQKNIVIYSDNSDQRPCQNLFKKWRGHKQDIFDLVRYNEKIIISSGFDQRICFYNIENQKILAQIEKSHEGWVSCLQILNDTNFVSGGMDGNIHFWQIQEKNIIKKIKTIRYVTERDIVGLLKLSKQYIMVYTPEMLAIINSRKGSTSSRIHLNSVLKENSLIQMSKTQIIYIDFIEQTLCLMDIRKKKFLKIIKAPYTQKARSLLKIDKNHLMIGCFCCIYIINICNLKVKHEKEIANGDIILMKLLDVQNKMVAISSEEGAFFTFQLNQDLYINNVQKYEINQQDEHCHVKSLDYISKKKQIVTGDTQGYITVWNTVKSDEDSQ